MNGNSDPRYFLNVEYLFYLLAKFLDRALNLFFRFFLWLQTHDFFVLAFLFSLIVFIGIIILAVKIKKLHWNIFSFSNFLLSIKAHGGEELTKGELRWQEIKDRLDSQNSSDWKLAVIEADSLINDILKKAGKEGENLGERLKNIEPSDFDNLQNVWEAHKLRNRIAHEPADFKLEKFEAERAIRQFEEALKELKYI